jgi:hypothetical protein
MYACMYIHTHIHSKPHTVDGLHDSVSLHFFSCIYINCRHFSNIYRTGALGALACVEHTYYAMSVCMCVYVRSHTCVKRECLGLLCVDHTAILIITEGRFQIFQRFSSSKLVPTTVESRFSALNYFENDSNSHVWTIHIVSSVWVQVNLRMHIWLICGKRECLGLLCMDLSYCVMCVYVNMHTCIVSCVCMYTC